MQPRIALIILLVVSAQFSLLARDLEIKQKTAIDAVDKKVEIIDGVQTVTVTLRPNAATYWTGEVYRFAGTFKSDNEIKVGKNTVGYTSRGWAMFNTTAIPQNATIQSATLKAYCRETASSGHRVRVKNLFIDPRTAGAIELYDYIGNANRIYADNWNAMTSTGYKEINYLPVGITELQFDVSNNNGWHGASFIEVTENLGINRGTFDGWNWNNGNNPEPLLIVTYTVDADLAVSNFSFLPQTINPGAHPDEVSFRLCNNGPAALTSPNTRVMADFYISGDTTFGGDINIGNNGYDFTLSPGSCTNVILTQTGRSYITIPQNASGNYYVFIRVRHASPSNLNDPESSNDHAMRVGSIIVSVEEILDLVPQSYSLSQNYPNPFNPISTIEFSLPKQSRVRVTVYDVLGREVEELVNADLNSGVFRTTWNGTHSSGKHSASGFYYYRLIAVPLDGGQPFVQTRKMILAK